MELSAKEKSYIWLDSFFLNATQKRRLLSESGSPVALVKNLQKFKHLLIEFGKESVYNSMSASLSDGGKYFAKVVSEFQRQGVTPIAYGSERYPKPWLELLDPPIVLYAKGDLSLLETRLFCVVGSRRTPPTVLKLGESICSELAKAFTVVTGVADGADSAAATGALKDGKVICLLAGGFGSIPKSNVGLLKSVAERGLLLAPAAFDVPVFAYSYEERNKLLAALCEGALVLSAGEKSGALITAKYAEEFAKPVFSIPYAPASSNGIGCNELIKRGARLTESAEDIFEAFGIKTEQKLGVELTETEQKLVEFLKGVEEAHVSELAEALKLPPFKLVAILSALETKGVVAKLGGNRYSAV